jgi:WD40 repeat protein
VSSLAFDGDGAQLASASHDGSVVLWQTPPVRGNLVPPLIAHAQRAHTDWALDAAYSPDGQWLATAGRDGLVLVWATGNWAEPVAQVAHGAAVRAVVFSPDSRLLAYGSEDGTVNLWEVASQRPLGQPWLGHTDFVQSLAFSPDGQWLASVGDDQSARVWEVATGELRHTLLAHSGTVWDVALAPTGPCW